MESQLINELLSPEIASALIGAAATIIGAIMAWFSAKSAAKREIRKLKEEWAREDRVSEEGKFAEMASAVSRYIQSGRPRHQREALESISTVQVASGGLFSNTLKTLYAKVLSGDIVQCQIRLSEVISLRQQVVGRK